MRFPPCYLAFRYFPLILGLGSSKKVTVAAQLSDPRNEVLHLVLGFELEKVESTTNVIALKQKLMASS